MTKDRFKDRYNASMPNARQRLQINRFKVAKQSPDSIVLDVVLGIMATLVMVAAVVTLGFGLQMLVTSPEFIRTVPLIGG